MQGVTRSQFFYGVMALFNVILLTDASNDAAFFVSAATSTGCLVMFVICSINIE